MFWEVPLVQKVRIHPAQLSTNIEETIKIELRNTVEGQITPETGLILLVIRVVDVGPGIVSQRTGYGLFDVKYDAIVFRPQSGQVVDAVIQSVSPQGFMAGAGPLEVFVATKSMPDGYTYDYENGSFHDSKAENVFMPGTKVRVKIISTKPHIDMSRLTGTATIKDPCFGVII